MPRKAATEVLEDISMLPGGLAEVADRVEAVDSISSPEEPGCSDPRFQGMPRRRVREDVVAEPASKDAAEPNQASVEPEDRARAVGCLFCRAVWGCSAPRCLGTTLRGAWVAQEDFRVHAEFLAETAELVREP